MFLPCKLIALRYLLQQWKPDWEHTSARLPEKTKCVDLRVSHSKQNTVETLQNGAINING